MNADLLAMLGGAGIHGGSSNRRENEAKSILEFKAGKMSTSLQPNGKYWVTPDPRRGLLSLTWTSSSSSSGRSSSSGSGGGVLKLEWKDRRTRSVVDTFTIVPSEDCTYEKVDTGREGDRIFMVSIAKQYHFYWMQDKFEENKDEENCVQMNTYLTDRTEASKAAGDHTTTTTTHNTTTTTTATTNDDTNLDMSGLGSGGLDNAALMQVMQGLGGNDTTTTSTTTTAPTAEEPPTPSTATTTTGTTNSSNLRTPVAPPQGQVDALSNILENLGMPQPNAAAATGTLTLADLQGAMAGLATTSPPAAAPLSEVASLPHIEQSGILSNAQVKSKLLSLLPEGQQTEDMLQENLRSPQVAQCWKTLTSALAEDPDSLPTLLANFQLPPTSNANNNNPIQAFLDAVLASVETKDTSEDTPNKTDDK